jgi:hypothetical protein
MGCALSTAARFEYEGTGFIPTSGGTAMYDKVKGTPLSSVRLTSHENLDDRECCEANVDMK